MHTLNTLNRIIIFTVKSIGGFQFRIQILYKINLGLLFLDGKKRKIKTLKRAK